MEPVTVAGLSIFSYVSTLCARLGAKLYALQANTGVMPVAIELVRDAYRMEGKLEELDVEE